VRSGFFGKYPAKAWPKSISINPDGWFHWVIGPIPKMAAALILSDRFALLRLPLEPLAVRIAGWFRGRKFPPSCTRPLRADISFAQHVHADISPLRDPNSRGPR
jgi:hypothetical protein